MTRARTRGRYCRLQRGMATVMTILAWLVFMALAGFYFQELLARQQNPNRDPSTQQDENGVREVVLQRNRAGHYVTAGSINGQAVVFLLDTGATGVAIPLPLARRLGIPAGTAMQTRTANGITTSYAARLTQVGVGEILLQDVRAAITPGLQGDEVLLGMSFLRQIEFSQRGNTLTLRQYP